MSGSDSDWGNWLFTYLFIEKQCEDDEALEKKAALNKASKFAGEDDVDSEEERKKKKEE